MAFVSETSSCFYWVIIPREYCLILLSKLSQSSPWLLFSKTLKDCEILCIKEYRSFGHAFGILWPSLDPLPCPKALAAFPRPRRMASAPHPGISPEEGVRELAWGPIGRHWKSLEQGQKCQKYTRKANRRT